MELLKSFLLAILMVVGGGGCIVLAAFGMVAIQNTYGVPVAIGVFVSACVVACTVVLHSTR